MAESFKSARRGLLRRVLCAFGWHSREAMGREDVRGFRWTRFYCQSCLEVLTVRDGYTGARYSNEVQIADDHWDIYERPSQAAWLFRLGIHNGELPPT